MPIQARRSTCHPSRPASPKHFLSSSCIVKLWLLLPSFPPSHHLSTLLYSVMLGAVLLGPRSSWHFRIFSRAPALLPGMPCRPAGHALWRKRPRARENSAAQAARHYFRTCPIMSSRFFPPSKFPRSEAPNAAFCLVTRRALLPISCWRAHRPEFRAVSDSLPIERILPASSHNVVPCSPHSISPFFSEDVNLSVLPFLFAKPRILTNIRNLTILICRIPRRCIRNFPA